MDKFSKTGDFKIRQLTNMPTKDGFITRGNRCNIISFYCQFCGCIHTQLRGDTFILEYEDEMFIICKKCANEYIQNNKM